MKSTPHDDDHWELPPCGAVFFGDMVLHMQKVMDLGDFIPQIIPVRFSINGHKYEFDLQESEVDDVFRLMAQNAAEDSVTSLRKSVTEFLLKRATEDKRQQLREDLELVPYRSADETRLSFMKLNGMIQGLFLKKNLGDA